MKFPKKILLVDHEPQVTALVRLALESTGKYLVRVEQDKRLALHVAPWFLPDLILLDGAKAKSEGEDINRQLKPTSAQGYAAAFSERDCGSGKEGDDQWILAHGSFSQPRFLVGRPHPLRG
jgi:PleD family two-component response regulator